MWPVLFSALIVSIAFAKQPPRSMSYLHDVKMNAPFDFTIRVPVALSFSSSINNCRPQNMQVEFFSRNRSLQIYGEPEDGNAQLTIIPFKRELPNFSICIVGTGGHNLPASCYSSTAAIFGQSNYTDTLTLVFEETIKEITLEGPISKYKGGIRIGYAQVFIAYEPLYALDYKLMRVTGTIETAPLSYYLKDPDEVEIRYSIWPNARMENKNNPTVYITFPK
uniref:Uncharacterized protein n=1 Tax=Schistocephalus solidus TaxID=70667 RepID=A0A0V0J871_SCHSO